MEPAFTFFSLEPKNRDEDDEASEAFYEATRTMP